MKNYLQSCKTAKDTGKCNLTKFSLRGRLKKGRGRGNLGAQMRKERNACKDAIVFSTFHAQILSVNIVTGQNLLNVNVRLNTFF